MVDALLGPELGLLQFHFLDGLLGGEPDLVAKVGQPFIGLAVFADHPAEAALIHLEFLHLANSRGGCAVPGGSARLVGILEETIRLAQQAGRARPGLDPWICASMAFHGVSKTWGAQPPGFSPAEVVAGMAAFLDAALLNP